LLNSSITGCAYARVIDLGRRYHGDAISPSAVSQPASAPNTPRSGLDRDLEQIRAISIEMGELIDGAIRRATEGLLHRDVAASNEVIRGDARVNELQERARLLCFSALETGATVARDIREILGFQHMTSELERMADHCVNIARVARDLADLPPLVEYIDVHKLSQLVAVQVREMLSSLVANDIDQARSVAARDDLVNRLYHRLVDELIAMMAEHPETVYSGTKLIAACQSFERIGDRVTNLAEDLIFLETGEIEELG
jgi:phosphate transport system protein